MKIAIVGIGYVGLSLAVLLSRHNQVVALDIVPEKVAMVNNRISPIRDEYIEKYFKEKDLDLEATLDPYKAFIDAEFIIICTPTNYQDDKQAFDTSTVIDVIKMINRMELKAAIVIKSTVPIGFTEKIKEKYSMKSVFFSPEFLREGQALYDSLYPSRIIVGEKSNNAIAFASLLSKASLRKDVPIKYMGSSEAEAVKLFVNSFLALRVSYFNELDTYAEIHGLNTKDIIDGICLDPRVGDFYNNPSFGYGGYCLPKDTKQLVSDFKDIPQNIIEAIVLSNKTRKLHIAEEILNRNPKTVGVYRLIMKSNSDNFRECAVNDIISTLHENNINVIIYEPNLNMTKFNKCRVENDFEIFKNVTDLIIANRVDQNLSDIMDKVYTRDVYQNN